VVRANELGLPTACEGDIRAAISMWILAKLSGETPWMSNVNVIDDTHIVLTHDGAPRPMLERYSIRPRMVTKLPAAIDGVYKRGSVVTLLRTDLRRAIVLRGTVEGSRLGLEACNSQILIKVDKGVDKLLRHPLGNHLAFVLSDVYDDVVDVLRAVGVELI